MSALDEKKCANCGEIAVPTDRFCRNCGQLLAPSSPAKAKQEPTPTSLPPAETLPSEETTLVKPTLIQFTRPREEIVAVIAKAYQDAALAEANMAEAAITLEKVRALFLSEQDALRLLEALNDELGLNVVGKLQTLLVELRAWARSVVITDQITRIRQSFAENAERGWNLWLETFGETLAEWDNEFCFKLIAAEIPFPAEFHAPIDFPGLFRFVRHERWAEAFPLFEYLAAQPFLHAVTRGRLLATAAQIKVFHFRPLDSEPLYERALKLAPGNPEIICVYGMYFQQIWKPDQARKYFQRARELDSKLDTGYVFEGDLDDDENKAEQAERLYRDAIRVAPGKSDGYLRLLRLYCRPEWIAEHLHQIEPLAEKALLVSPFDKQSNFLALGYAYQRGKRFEQAHSWFDKAAEIDPARVEVYTAHGYAYVEEKAFEKAERAFQRAIEVAPESDEGYRGMAWNLQSQEKWSEALAYYQRCLPLRPAWSAKLNANIGWMRLKMDALQDSESDLLNALRDDPNDTFVEGRLLELVQAWGQRLPERAVELLHQMQTTYLGALRQQTQDEPLVSFLHHVARDYFKIARDKEAASALYEELVQIKGPKYRSECQNQLGNYYYAEKEYEDAARAYTNAIEAAPEEALYYSNLGFALRQQSKWEEAKHAFEKAIKLAPEKNYQKDLAFNHNEQANEWYRARDYRRALGAYEQANQLNPGEVVYYENMAHAWDNLIPVDGAGSVEHAVTALTQAVERAPENKFYRRWLKTLKSQQRLGQTFGRVPFVNPPAPPIISIEVSKDMASDIWMDADAATIHELVRSDLQGIRDWCVTTYGFKLPEIQFQVAAHLEGGKYILNLHGTPWEQGTLPMGKRIFVGDESELRAAGITLEETTNLFNGRTAYLVTADVTEKIKSQNLLWSTAGSAILHLGGMARRNLPQFIDHPMVKELLETNGSTVCKSMLASLEELTTLTCILRSLVDEFVPLKEVEAICTLVHAQWSLRAGLVSIVTRARMLDSIRPSLYGNEPGCRLIWLSVELEKMIEEGIFTEPNREPYLALTPEVTQRALSAIRDRITGLPGNVALATHSSQTRPFVRKLAELEFPNLGVIAQDELLPGYAERSLDTIEWQA